MVLENLLTVSRRQQDQRDQQLDQQQRGAHVPGPTHAAPHPCSPLENLSEPPGPRKPTGVLVVPRACVRCSYTFTLRRAPLYASDRRARAHGGGQAVTSPHNQPFLCLSSILEAGRLEVLGLTVDQGPGVTDPTPNLPKTASDSGLCRSRACPHLIGRIRRGSCYNCVTCVLLPTLWSL